MHEVVLRRFPFKRGEAFTGKIIVDVDARANGPTYVTHATRVQHQGERPAIRITVYEEVANDQRIQHSHPELLCGRNAINRARLREVRTGLLPRRRLVVPRRYRPKGAS